MDVRRFLTLAVLLVVPAIASAQDWTSPDGFLSVTPPTPDVFDKLPTPPPPFVALWVSHDESMKFGVMKIQIPPTLKLNQSSAEQGLAEEIGGKVTRLPTKQLSGHEVWTMTANGPSIEITQSLVRHDGSLYKVMAAAVGAEDNSDSVDQFISSMSIAEQAKDQAPQQPSRKPVQDLGETVDSHNLSKTIGGIGALLAIALLVYFAVQRKNA